MAHTRLPSGHHGAQGGRKAYWDQVWSEQVWLPWVRDRVRLEVRDGRDPSCLLLRRNPERERANNCEERRVHGQLGLGDPLLRQRRRAQSGNRHCLLSQHHSWEEKREPGLLTLKPQADFNLMERVFGLRFFMWTFFKSLLNWLQ